MFKKVYLLTNSNVVDAICIILQVSRFSWLLEFRRHVAFSVRCGFDNKHIMQP